MSSERISGGIADKIEELGIPKAETSNAELIAAELESVSPVVHGQKGKNNRNVAMYHPVVAFPEYDCAGRTMEFFYPK